MRNVILFFVFELFFCVSAIKLNKGWCGCGAAADVEPKAVSKQEPEAEVQSYRMEKIEHDRGILEALTLKREEIEMAMQKTQNDIKNVEDALSVLDGQIKANSDQNTAALTKMGMNFCFRGGSQSFWRRL